MPVGELNSSEVYIAEDDIRSVLDAMVNPSGRPPNFDSLNSLTLIDGFLADPDLPPIQSSREFAIYEVIAQLISQELRTQRQKLGMPEASKSFTVAEHINNIRSDIRQNSDELLDWSFLYHHYIQTDLNIGVDKFSDLIGADSRTVRRYRQRSIQRLTRHLIRAEWQTRIVRRKQRLCAQLPTGNKSIHLYGRQEQLQAALGIILNNPTATLFVSGAKGIGKSVFVQELMRQCINIPETHCFDHLVWVDRPNDITQVQDAIQNIVPVHNSRISLREWMMIYHLAVVINDAQHIITHDPEQLDDLLQFLHPACVCITSETYRPLVWVDSHIALGELDTQATTQLIVATSQGKWGDYHIPSEADIATIRQIAGGNPLAIMLTVQNVAIGDTHLNTDLLDRLLGYAYAGLTLEEKRAWLALCLCPTDGFAEADLVHLWPRHIASEHFMSLVHRNLIDFNHSSGKYRLCTVARNYLASMYQRSSECLMLVSELLESVHNYAADYPFLALEIMESVINLNWVNLDEAIKRRWLSRLLQSNVNLTYHPKWRNLALKTIPKLNVDSELKMLYAVVLRQLGRWREAEDVFREVIEDTGRTGQFRIQAQARIEIAVIHRYCGRYSEAETNLQQATRMASRYEDHKLVSLAILEKAQLAIDSQNGRSALQFLSQSPLASRPSARWFTLAAEAHLQVGDFVACLDQITQAFALVQNSRLDMGRLHDLMGRAHLAAAEYDKALHRFLVAISCFSEAEDPFALARSLSNAGAILLHQESYYDAADKLLQAHQIQSHLGDSVGLLVTERNLNICKTHLPNLRLKRNPSARSFLPSDYKFDLNHPDISIT